MQHSLDNLKNYSTSSMYFDFFVCFRWGNKFGSCYSNLAQSGSPNSLKGKNGFLKMISVMLALCIFFLTKYIS